MSIFTDWFSGRAIRKPTPPAIPVTPTPTAPANSPHIKIDDWNDTVGRWLEMPVPFVGARRVDLADVGGVWSTSRVTVLSGSLTVTGLLTSGPHHPAISGPDRGAVFTAGQGFKIFCAMGAATAHRKSGWDMVNYGVVTKELGQIFQISAQVVYV